MMRFWREQWYRLIRTYDMPEDRAVWLQAEASRLDSLNQSLGHAIVSIDNSDLKDVLVTLQRDSLRKWHKTCMMLDLDYNQEDYV